MFFCCGRLAADPRPPAARFLFRLVVLPQSVFCTMEEADGGTGYSESLESEQNGELLGLKTAPLEA